MKEVFFNIILFVLLSIAVSSLSGCNGSADLPGGPIVQEPGQAGNAAEKRDGLKKPTDYPPIANAIAQADIKNLDGTTFKIADRKGKVILLNMWATWCGPCRSEMPALVKMQDRHRDQGLQVIGLNSDDESIEDINKFAESLSLNYQIAWADPSLQKELLKISQFGGIPQSFLIDREGKLRGVFRGANPADIRKMEALVAKVVAGDEGDVPVTNTQPSDQTPANANEMSGK